MAGATITLAGVALALDAAGAVWHGGEQVLMVADLHLEKGSSYARSGQMLPPYDTLATLDRLARLVARHRPGRLVLLGDSFHDRAAGDRLPEAAWQRLDALGQRTELIWITGNHDPNLPDGLPGTVCAALDLGPIRLCHIPSPARPANGEIAGHLHPVARIRTRAGIVRRPCFVSDARRLILPAFGAFAGGLNVRDPAIAGLLDDPVLHAAGGNRLIRLGFDRTVG